ncbi:hypothetical protein [Caenimonas koreensis]|uniref:Glycine zipper n=1 Tax=Caenimonas koreensis DSM 17982 TaxID=1121255 RepID=A0A844AVN4_9BURK|nr:hypothetical protein [Caenimonas koreensis]MRD48455.1 hypothetical protein [Caenimonas koreensis DSM 17982]
MSDKNPTNADPITGAAGAHPVGTGLGAAGGAAAGAAIGSMGGPVGAVIGGAVGAIAGGLAGKGAGESVNPTAEETYWRDNYTKTPGYKPGYTYDDYAPAYRTGYSGWERAGAAGETFETHEANMRNEYERTKGSSRLVWEEAKDASRAAWNRVERAIPGDSDHDGR